MRRVFELLATACRYRLEIDQVYVLCDVRVLSACRTRRASELVSLTLVATWLRAVAATPTPQRPFMPFYPISSQVRLPGCMRGVACGVRCTVNGGAFSATGFEKLLHQGFHTGSLVASIGVWGCYGNFKFRRERLAVRVVHPPRRRTMASCYGSISAPSTGITDDLQCLPIRTVLPDGTGVEIDYFRER